MCSFIKNVLHDWSLCNILIFSEFLENLWADSGHGTFRLCAFSVIFIECFHYSVFKVALGAKFDQILISFPKCCIVKPKTCLLFIYGLGT